MDTQNLIDMANRIGDFFDSMPDREEAITGVADHIRRFWEPRMRRAFARSARCAAGERHRDVGDRQREALVKNRERLTPAEPSIA